MSANRLWAAMFAALFLGASGCSESEQSARTGPASALPATTGPAPTAAAEHRALAERALSAQRVYAPAGDSAIEHFLRLRDEGGSDASVETALLELLPYAVIGCEQAIASQQLAEAQRLLALIERAEPGFPAIVRLKAALAEADGAQAQQALVATETERQRLLAVARDAELSATASAALAASAASSAQVAPAPAPEPPARQPVVTAVPAAAATAPVVVAAPLPAPVPAPDAALATTPASTSPSPKPNTSRALISGAAPRYPLSARRRKLEGDVTLTFTIQPDGSVASPRVVAATPPGVFDEAALAAASRWRFEAAAAPTQVTRQLRFRLDSGS